MFFPFSNSNTYHSGILCYLKSKLKYNLIGVPGIAWTLNPDNLICNEEGANFYSLPCYNNTILEINFEGHAASITRYAIQGRNYPLPTDLMQSFQILGRKLDSSWIVLDTVMNNPLINKQSFNFSTDANIWVNAIRIVNIGLADGITRQEFNYINTFGAIEVFGKLLFGNPTSDLFYFTFKVIHWTALFFSMMITSE